MLSFAKLSSQLFHWFVTIETDRVYKAVRKIAAMRTVRPFTPGKGANGNPHRKDAAIRDLGQTLIDSYIKEARLLRFDVQRGLTDNDGTSIVHDFVDMTSKPKGKVGNDTALVMVDVDYYLDMNKYLSEFKPIFIYRLVPTTVRSVTEGHEYYISDDHVHWRAHGGYTAVHRVWNYRSDFCCASSFFTTWCYRVHNFYLGQDRVVTSLIPYCRFPRFLWWLPGILKGGRFEKISYFSYTKRGTDEKWNVISSHGIDGCHISVAANDRLSMAVNVPLDKFSYLVDHQRVFKFTGAMPEHVPNTVFGNNQCKLLAKYAVDYVKYRHQIEVAEVGIGAPVAVEQPVEDCNCATHDPRSDSNHYKVGPHKATVDKPTVTKVVNIKTNAVPKAPIRDKEAAKKMIEERIKKPNNEARAKVNISPFMMKTFVKWLVKTIGPVSPLSCEQVLERIRPQYKDKIKLNQTLQLASCCSNTEGFIKAESYDEVKDPRGITPLNLMTQAHLYRFVYALQDALHTQKWFAFGRPPAELSSNLRDMSAAAMERNFVAVEGDYSRFDGTVTKPARMLEAMIYKAFFPGHLAQIDDVLKYTKNLSVIVKGVKYFSGNVRCSGAADTCLMNSLLNLFVMYLTVGEKVGECAVVGGDDSIIFIPETKVERLVANAGKCGFKMKHKIAKPGRPFTLLARYFQWGEASSMCDPARFAKVGLLNRPGLNPTAKYTLSIYKAKIRCLMDCDSNTPKIGRFLSHLNDKFSSVIDVSGASSADVERKYNLNKELPYLMSLGLGSWINEYRPWMDDVVRNIDLRVDGDELSMWVVK